MSRPPAAELELELLQLQLIRRPVRRQGDNDPRLSPGVREEVLGGGGGGGWGWTVYGLHTGVKSVSHHSKSAAKGSGRCQRNRKGAGSQVDIEFYRRTDSVTVNMHRRGGAETHVLYILFTERS